MYTEMRSQYLEEPYVQRCYKTWWTIYILERQMSSLLGVPIGIADGSISTPFPSMAGQSQQSTILTIQVRLSQILAMIDQS